MNLEILLVFESGDDRYTTTVTPDSDWWSLDLTGQLDVIPGMRVTALFEKGPVAWVVSETPFTSLGAEVDLTEQAMEGRGFSPDAPLGVAVNGVDLPGGAVTDAGGHFVIELAGRGVTVEPGDVITLSQTEGTFDLAVADISFIRFDAETGVAAGTVSGSDSVGVGIRIREASGAIRAESQSNVTATGGIWQALFEPLGPGESVVAAWVTAADSFLGTRVHLNPTANPHLGLDEPFGNVSGHEFAPGETVTMRVNEGEWSAIGVTDVVGSFDINAAVVVGPGDVLEIEVEGIRRGLTIPDLTFDVYDPGTRSASGTTSLPDGTILSLNVVPTQEEGWEGYQVGYWTAPGH